MSATLTCRSCGSRDLADVVNLGSQPLANNLLRPADAGRPEPRFPLELRVCTDCWLMQISHEVPPVELFSNYVYFSSFSDQMLRHAREAASRYIREKALDATSFVVEVASNDGYLLKNFTAAGIPCVGFEPAANIAEAARAAGVPTRCQFFSAESARALAGEDGAADLILGNNVFAHAPDTNDFVRGLATLVKPNGWIVLEFPYGVDMLDKVEFDTIYHEHVFYFTLTPLIPLLARHGLEIFDVERLRIHGGSLRVFAGHRGAHPVRNSVRDLQAEEDRRGVGTIGCYAEFSSRAAKIRSDLEAFLRERRREGARVAAYGASAKGSTLLNFVGEAAKNIEFIADRSHHKQGLLSPGCHIPIAPAGALADRAPDYAILLAWNFADEILGQQEPFLARGGKFVIPLPALQIVGR